MLTGNAGGCGFHPSRCPPGEVTGEIYIVNAVVNNGKVRSRSPRRINAILKLTVDVQYAV